MKTLTLLLALIHFAPAAMADVYKEVRSATDAIDSDYEGGAAANSVFCQKGKTSVEFFVYQYAVSGCELTRGKRICTKLMQPTGTDGAIHCGPGKWTESRKRTLLLKRQRGTACGERLDQMTKKLEKQGYHCESGNFQ